MADNIQVTQGTGTNMATNDVSGVHYQKIKIVDGSSGSTVSIDSGGGPEEHALRVTIANNSTGVISVDDNGGALTVDGEVTANLGATDNAVLDAIQAAVEGTLTADVTGQGDVPVTLDGEEITANLGATDNAVLDTIATNTGAALTDTELRATPVPVSGTLTGITGDVSIDDGGNTITVDGTVTANLGATDNAVLDVISTHVNWLNEYAQAGDASTQMRVDVISALPAGTANIGSITPYAQASSFISGSTLSITDTTATSVIPAQGAGVIIYITSILVTNGDADTGTFVNITDGSGGTVMWSGYASEGGGGFSQSFPVPLKFTANTAVYTQCVSSGATVRVCCSGYKA